MDSGPGSGSRPQGSSLDRVAGLPHKTEEFCSTWSIWAEIVPPGALLTLRLRYAGVRGDVMSKVTIGFGVLLIALGGWGYVATGSEHPTALIPCYFGIVLAICGFLANSENAKRRMLWMHIAVTVGLLGFLGTIPAVIDMIRMLRGVSFPHPVAVEEKAGMSLLCLVFVGFCVRSFIAARRSRGVAAA